MERFTVATRLGQPLRNICVTNYHGYVPPAESTSRSFPPLGLITRYVTVVMRQVSLVEQELLNLPEHPSSLPVFSGVRVARFLVFWIVFCRSLFVPFLLYCVSLFDLRILITLLVSSNYLFLLDLELFPQLINLKCEVFLVIKMKTPLWSFMVATVSWLTVVEYLCHKWPRTCSVLVITIGPFHIHDLSPVFLHDRFH